MELSRELKIWRSSHYVQYFVLIAAYYCNYVSATLSPTKVPTMTPTVSPTTPTVIPTASPSSFLSIYNNIYLLAGASATATASSGTGGKATSAKFVTPQSIFQDSTGLLYVTDDTEGCIRTFNPFTDNIVKSFAGVCGTAGDTQNRPATSALLNDVSGTRGDTIGNVYIADHANHKIKKVTSGTATLFAGTGNTGQDGDGGKATAANLGYPNDIFIDSSGILYVVMYYACEVRKIATNSIITLYAGVDTANAYSGDGGPATSAKFNYPRRSVLDTLGKLYVTDGGNSRVRVISATGIVTLFAGTGSTAYLGENLPPTSANLMTPIGIDLNDVNGDLYFGDADQYRIYLISASSGLLNTYAGSGVVGNTGNGGAATAATFSDARVPVLDTNGNVYINDRTNKNIRVVYSVQPTASPTVVPSLTPTVTPTVIPSIAPTAVPSTASPSIIPTVAPSLRPSQAPTLLPTTGLPSATPSTIAPSSAPSASPSVTPSVHPSMLPTLQPFDGPSPAPSRVPTVSPTVVPSAAPTVTPTVTPTVLPSTAPSVAPSVVPTLLPTSSKPTCMPSMRPTYSPASSPSLLPVGASPSYSVRNSISFAGVTSGGGVLSWGASCCGGDATSVSGSVSSNVVEVVHSKHAFAARKSDGSVVAWGLSQNIVGSTQYDSAATGAVSLVATEQAFAGVTSSGGVFAFGARCCGGNVDQYGYAQYLTSDVGSVRANAGAFCALKNDGSVYCWGSEFAGGGVSSLTRSDLSDIMMLSSTRSAFAGLTHDGNVIVWGSTTFGGVVPGAVNAKIAGSVQHIVSSASSFVAYTASGLYSWGSTKDDEDMSVSGSFKYVAHTSYAFVGVRSNGTASSWGSSDAGGDASSVAESLKNVSHVVGNTVAFAAITSVGGVVAWGNTKSVSSLSSVSSHIGSDVSTVYYTSRAFAVISAGAVIVWGDSGNGGEMSSAVATELSSGVTMVCANDNAFTAIKSDGSAYCWGSSNSVVEGVVSGDYSQLATC